MAPFKVGDTVLWPMNLNSPQYIRSGRVTRVGTDHGEVCLWVDDHLKPEDCVYAAYCWPARVREELVAVLTERERLKAAYDDSIKLVYELRNAIGRGEK